MDAGALVFGSEGYGFEEFYSFRMHTDAANYSGDGWFINTYLKTMKHASDSCGKRLLDVFTIHWYPNLNEDVGSEDTSATVRAARLQCTRSLWDSTYTEDSWIGQWLQKLFAFNP